MKRSLPPLNALRIFEVSGRVGSYGKAADELNITHGAVSQQIKILEAWLGVKLFSRLGRSVELTEQGRQYLASIGPAMAAIVNASARLTSRRAITVNAQPALTMHWLLPRLVSFRERYPGIEISITTGIDPVEQLPKSLDVIIRRKPNHAESFLRREFLSELNFPVCSPRVIKQEPISAPADLARHTLIHSEPRPQDWPNWLRMFGPSNLTPAHVLHLEFLYFAIQAAVDGLGIAMGASSLVEKELTERRLVMPLGSRIARSTPYAMFTKPNISPSSPAGLFCEWLAEEGARYDAELPKLLKVARKDIP